VDSSSICFEAGFPTLHSIIFAMKLTAQFILFFFIWYLPMANGVGDHNGTPQRPSSKGSSKQGLVRSQSAPARLGTLKLKAVKPKVAAPTAKLTVEILNPQSPQSPQLPSLIPDTGSSWASFASSQGDPQGSINPLTLEPRTRRAVRRRVRRKV